MKGKTIREKRMGDEAWKKSFIITKIASNIAKRIYSSVKEYIILVAKLNVLNREKEFEQNVG